jgi:sugar lactone lactonase YvrE
MKTKHILLTFITTLTFTQAAHSAPAELDRWRSYNGVTWAADGKAFSGSVGAPIAGIHFDKNNRAFVSTPRLISAAAPATLSILDTSINGGAARLTAFPSESGNSTANTTTTTPEHSLRNVLGFYVDNRNGWLWALDMGFVAGEAEAPVGAQKIVVYDLVTGKVVKRIVLDAVADRKGSFLNDIAVDEVRKIAYISDSGLRSAPNNQAAIIVADFKTGHAQRLLNRHVSVLPESGVKVFSNGAEVWAGNPLLVGINGIALSPDARTLYWTVTAGEHAFSIPTQVLRDAKASEQQVSGAIAPLGKVGGNTDGIVTDKRGQLYITDVTNNGIVRYNPKTKTMRLIASDPQVSWPDTAAITADGHLVFTSSQLNQHFAGAVKAGEERYDLWRMRVGAD